MGFDKLLSFFMKNLQNNIVEDLYNKPVVVTNHIYFDMNFIVYNSISNIENDVNSIYKLVFAIPYTNIGIIENKLQTIFNTYHWKQVTKNINMIDILDGNNISEIMENFNKMISIYIYDLFYWDVYNSISNYIKKNHPIQFIRSINLFLDGIPTYAKILEQRRRRMKNYVDSKNRKKIFNTYFENIVQDLITEDDITFDYFEWLKHLFSFDKSLGPYSEIMILLGNFILGKLKDDYSDIIVTLNNSTNNGESDYKIFKHIKDNNIDCDVTIHSCDSDFIFMIVWYQLLCNTSSIDINIMLIYYNKTSYNKNNIINTLICGKKINNLLLEKYNNINELNCDVNVNVIYDLLLILLMFGNDIIPPSYELGTELNLKLLFETHNVLYQNNNFIINVNSVDIINFTNLSKWLKLIKERNSFSIIILNRFYKLPYNLIINMTEKYDIHNIINKVLIPYHIKMCENNISTDITDFRTKLKSDIMYDEILLKDSHIEDYIDIINSRDYGLIRIERNYDIESNPYQTLYNYITVIAYNNTEDEFNRPYKIFFDNLIDSSKEYIEITKSCNTKQYIELIISLSHIFFHKFDLYTPYSLFHYGEMLAPSIDMIIDFIDNNNIKTISESCYKTAQKIDNYFNPISHHLFITPYLLESTYVNSIKNIEYINSLLNVVGENIPGIWYKENESFILKNFDPNQIINLSNSMIQLYQDKFINNIFKSSDNLLYYEL